MKAYENDFFEFPVERSNTIGDEIFILFSASEREKLRTMDYLIKTMV